MKPQKQRGFTLIEVLIVVGIIGLLASVILVGLNSSRAKARDARRLSDLRQVQQGLELYYTKNGSYPSASSWSALSSEITGANIGIRKIPSDPQVPTVSDSSGAGDSKQYQYASDGQDYVLWAQLEEEDSPLQKDSITSGTVSGVSCSGSRDFCIAP